MIPKQLLLSRRNIINNYQTDQELTTGPFPNKRQSIHFNILHKYDYGCRKLSLSLQSAAILDNKLSPSQLKYFLQQRTNLTTLKLDFSTIMPSYQLIIFTRQLKEMTSLRNLTLELRPLEFDKKFFWCLCQALSNLKSLEHLTINLQTNLKNQEIVYSLKLVLSHLRQLTSFKLNYFNRSIYQIQKHNNKLPAILHGLNRLPKLKELDLTTFTLSEVVNKAFGHLFKLKLNALSLALINAFNTKHLIQLQQLLANLPDLKRLSLNCTEIHAQITDENFKPILNAITNLNLSEFKLITYRNLTDIGLKNLLNTLNTQPNLSRLSLDFSLSNSITSQGLENLAEQFSQLAKLQSLEIKFNYYLNLNNQSLIHLQTALQKLPAPLASLVLSFENSSLNSYGLDDFWQVIAKQKQLTKLALIFTDSQLLQDSDLSKLRYTVTELNQLTELALNFSGCIKISETGYGYLQEMLKQLPKLDNVELKLPSLIDDDEVNWEKYFREGLARHVDLQLEIL